MSATTTAGQPDYAGGAFLLDLTISGRVWRYTTRAGGVSVSTEAGGSLPYSEGMAPLEVTIEAGRPLGDVGIEVLGGSDSWALLVARGHRIETGRAVLRWWLPGDTIEAARVIIRGRVTQPSYGDSSTPLAFAISRHLRAAGEIPSPAMRVDASTWPVTAGATVAPEAIGGAYPIVIGNPGYITGLPDGIGVALGTVPALFVEYQDPAGNYTGSRVLMAGHPVVQTTGYLVDQSARRASSCTLIETADATGRTVTVADFGGLTDYHDPQPIPSHEWASAWELGGGLPSRTDPTVAMRGIGDVLYWLLTEWTSIEVDRGRMQAHADALNVYRLDFSITSPVQVWAWIQSAVLPLLPIEWVEGRHGGYFRIWRLTARAHEAVAHLDATPRTGNVVRVSEVEYTGGEHYNRITLHYARGGGQSRHLKRRTIAAEYDPDDTSSLASPWARHSVSLLAAPDLGDDGIRPLTVSTDIVSDDTTAALILRHLIERYAVSRRLVTVEGPHSLARLDVSDVVTLTAGDLSLSSEVAIIRAVTLSDLGVTLDLLLLDDPTTMRRQ